MSSMPFLLHRKFYLVIFFLACIPTWFVISLGISTPFDEMAHFDYADKLAHFEVPEVNEQYGQRTLRIVACQINDPGEAWAGVRDCSAKTINPDVAPFQGQSSATSYSPTYYVFVAVNYRLCDITLGEVANVSPLTCMRLANSLLAGLSAVLLVGIAAMLGFPLLASSAAALISVNSPALIQQFATVNSDAGAVFSIIGCLFMAIYLPRKRRSQNKPLFESLSPRDYFFNTTTIMFVLSCSILISMKETSLLILPTASILFTRMIFKNHTTRDSLNLRFFNLNFFYLSNLAVISAVTFCVGLVRWSQPKIRGVGGEDWMVIALKGDGSLTIEALLRPVKDLFSSSSQLVWPRFDDEIAMSLSLFLSSLFVAALFLGSLDLHRQKVRRVELTKILGQSLQAGVLTLPIMVVLLGLLSWKLTGMVISQPRYYLPATSVFTALVLVFLFSLARSRAVIFSFSLFSLLLSVSYFA
jgi:hypothetical protein